MKLKLFLLVGVLLLCSGVAFGQSGIITLELVNGLHGSSADTLALNTEITFYIRTNNNTGGSINGITSGFRIYSEDGAVWDTIVPASTGVITTEMFDNGVFFYPNDQIGTTTGSGADTIGFGGFTIFKPGIPDGLDDTTLTITIGPLTDASSDKTICLDSTFYDPSGVWKWAAAGAVNHFPTWDGPHCYTVYVDPDGVKSVAGDNLPTTFALGQNYPNPFNPTTQIAFDLPTRSQVTLTVYNVLGQQVNTLVNEKLGAGSYEADWDGRSSGGNDVASGIYFYRLHTESFTQTKKMILLK